MAKIRNVSGEDRDVPWLNRTVQADAVVTVPDSDLESYTCQPDTWADETPVKKGSN